MKMRFTLCKTVIVGLLIVAYAHTADVALWGMFEISITNEKSYSNKFRDVLLEATFTSPTGIDIPFWGFFDGDGTGGPDRMDVVANWQADAAGEISGTVWKLRFMPNLAGIWEYSWKFSDDSKTGSGTFNCVKDGAYPGVINVDWDGNVRYLCNSTGPFFAKPTGMWSFVGITYDTSECSQLYDKFINKGFNILMQQGTLPVWPRPRFGSTSPDNNGGVNDPHITIWYQKKNWECVCDGPTETEANNTYDTDRMNLFTWKRLDQHFAYLAKRKTYFLGWQGFNVKRTWPIMPHKFEREKYDWYIRYAMARLAPYYNLIWHNTWESTNGAEWLWDNLNNKKFDPWRRLQVNVQNTADVIDGDFQWNTIPVTSKKPYWSLEDNTGKGLWWVERFGSDQKKALAIEMKFLLNASLAMPVEYQSGVTAFSKHLTLKGMDYIAHAYNYIGDNVAFWHKDVQGHNELVSGGGTTAFCLARPGIEYVVYREGGGSVELDLGSANATFDLIKFDPFANKTESGGTVQGGSKVTLTASGDFHVLHLKAGGTTAQLYLQKAAIISANEMPKHRVFDMRGRQIQNFKKADMHISLEANQSLNKSFLNGTLIIYSYKNE